MARKRSSKTFRDRIGNNIKITQKSYNKLMHLAENARRRLRAMLSAPDADNYNIPKPEEYTIKNLLNRIANGERVQSVIREVNNLTAEKIKTGVPITAQKTVSGFVMSPAQVRDLKRAVDRANKEIRKARRKFSDFKDLLPTTFSYSDVSQNIINEQSLNNKINDLALFTTENLVPTAINDSGEAGTMAEYLYNRNILERENLRRAQLSEQQDPKNNKGYIRQQADVDRAPIDIDVIPDLQTLRERARTWDDPARIYRANLFLANYSSQLDKFESVAVHNGYYNDVVEERFQYIRDVIAKLYYNEEAITFLSENMPNINIALLYGDISGTGFDEIYNDWADIAIMYDIDV